MMIRGRSAVSFRVISVATLLGLSGTVWAGQDPSSSAQGSEQGAGKYSCKADPAWVTNPNPPDEIPGGGETFCEFYQFSWQWFFYLMSPSADNPQLRNFQVESNYPVLLSGQDSCAAESSGSGLLLRLVKENDDSPEFVLPEDIHQAGDKATIYDQSGNVVFYSIAFDRSYCDAPASGNLPVGAIELKMAWQVIDDADKDDYIWMDAELTPGSDGSDPISETLGLIGFHLVRGTADHPELVWASYEHQLNAPNCVSPAQAPADGWSFLSATCQAALNDPGSQPDSGCNFNQASSAEAITGGTPTEICRIFPEGTAPGDHKGKTNIANVQDLNAQLVGEGGIIDSLPADDPMAVLENYFNIGALWVSDPSKPSSTDNQRGSMQLANPVMETTFQGSLSFDGSSVTPSTQGVVNCFACHGYTPGKTATTGLSHIFSEIKQQQGN